MQSGEGWCTGCFSLVDANAHPRVPQRETESTEYGMCACGGRDRVRDPRQFCGSKQALRGSALIGPARLA